MTHSMCSANAWVLRRIVENIRNRSRDKMARYIHIYAARIVFNCSWTPGVCDWSSFVFSIPLDKGEG